MPNKRPIPSLRHGLMPKRESVESTIAVTAIKRGIKTNHSSYSSIGIAMKPPTTVKRAWQKLAPMPAMIAQINAIVSPAE